MFEFDRGLIQRSTVEILGPENTWARGFITRGGSVITAAHCLPKPPDASNPDPPVDVCVRYLLKPDKCWTLQVMFADVCQDVAVLQGDFEPAAAKLEDLPEEPEIEGLQIQLSANGFEYPHRIDLAILDLSSEWLFGTGNVDSQTSARIHIELLKPDRFITSGTSGSPIVDQDGRVWGIVSSATKKLAIENYCAAIADGPWLTNTLPGWFLLEEKAAIDDE